MGRRRPEAQGILIVCGSALVRLVTTIARIYSARGWVRGAEPHHTLRRVNAEVVGQSRVVITRRTVVCNPAAVVVGLDASTDDGRSVHMEGGSRRDSADSDVPALLNIHDPSIWGAQQSKRY